MPAVNSSSRPKVLPTRFNRLIYGGFVLLGIYYLVRAEFSDALMYLGIALVADPFDQTVSWKQRPFWQRAWLVIHLLAMLAVLLITWL